MFNNFFLTLKMTVTVVVTTVVFTISFVSTSYADSAPIFATLKKRYLTLRNTDNQLTKLAEWKTIAREFESAVRRYPKDSEAPPALLNASIVYEELYRASRDKEYLSSALRLLGKLAQAYPGNTLADDALLRRGDLLLYEMEDPKLARKSYQEVVEAYRDSDMYDIAVVRIQALQGERKLANEHIVEFPELDLRKDVEHVVVLDPGHGGEDLGAVGPSKLLEKDVVLAVAFELERLLSALPNVEVVLTRRRDDFIPLAERTALANSVNADIFVSLHANASIKKNMSGFEMYYLDNAGDKASKKLAERENASTQFEKGGTADTNSADLHFMISDLIQYGKRDDSIELANAIRASFNSELKPRWNNIRDLGVKRAPFFVLVGAHMPCVLVEMFFIDHALDGVRLAQGEFRADIAKALQAGILRYLKEKA